MKRKHTAASIASLVSCLVSLALAGSASAAGVFYVQTGNPACSNTGPGTEAFPYCSIAAAVVARGGPGTTINVKPGVYREEVLIDAVATQASPFVLQALGSPVVVDGTDDFSSPGQWTNYSGDVWLAASVIWEPSQVFANGARLTPSVDAPNALPTGTFRYLAGSGLYVNVGGGNPANQQAAVGGNRRYGFRLSGAAWVTVNGFQVTRTEDKGIYLKSGTHDCIISNNSSSYCDGYGIQAAACSSLVIRGNIVSYSHRHGIGLTGGTTASIIEDNETFGNARPLERAANGLYLYDSRANLIRRNRIHDNQDTGLHMQSASDNNILIHNRSWNNGDHGYDHLYVAGTYHIGDIAYGNYKDGFSIEGNSPNTTLYDCISVNNGITTAEFDLWIDTPSSIGFVSDHNIFWNSTSQSPIKYVNTEYSTIAAYRAASGQDAQSLQADPRWVNAAAGDFHLLAGSPAIDAAKTDIAHWPELDADQHTRVDDPATPNTGVGPVLFADRGPFEYLSTGAPDQPPVVNSPALVTGNEGLPLAVNVTASDPDGAFTLTATYTSLPSGNAAFTAGAGNATGTLGWTPTFSDSGTYSVRFIAASNGLADTSFTLIRVNNVDRRPDVVSPASATGTEAAPLTVNVTATDIDGDAITSLGVIAADLPAGAGFTAGAGNTTGTLNWTPGYADSGNRSVRFVAVAHGLADTSVTVIHVNNVDRRPDAVSPATATGTEAVPLAVNVTAVDLDGDAIASLAAVAADLPVGAGFTVGAGNATGTLNWTPSYADSGSYAVRFVATAGGLADTSVTLIHVDDADRPPDVTSPPSAAGAEAVPFTVNVTAVDLDGDPISSLHVIPADLPAGAGFTAGAGNATGTLNWTPGYADSGSRMVRFVAVARGLADTSVTVIYIANGDRAPDVSSPASATATETLPLTVNVTASDLDGDAMALTADLTGLPVGAGFAAGAGGTSGTLSWTPTYADSGSYTARFIASAHGLADTSVTLIHVTNVDRPPDVTSPASALGSEATPLTVNVTASDLDGDVIASLAAILTDLPAGAGFTAGAGNTTGTLGWTPSYADSGSYPVRFVATAGGLADTSVTLIHVGNADRAPEVTAPASAAGTEAVPLTVNVAATDVDGDAISSLDVIAADLPAGAGFTAGAGNTTGTLNWTPGYADSGNRSVRFVAVAHGLADTSVTVIHVNNVDRRPDVVSAATATGTEAVPLAVNVTAVDLDGDAIASLAAVAADLPVGAGFTAGAGNATGTLNWTPSYADSGSYAVRFVATAGGLADTSVTLIHVDDADRPPDVTSPPSAAGAEAVPFTVNVTAVDLDGDAISSLHVIPADLPAGAGFTAGAGNATGTLNWTPSYADSGSRMVRFVAVARGLADTSVTVIYIANGDRAPDVSSPASATATETLPLTVNVTASDLDGDAMALTADLTGLPVGAGFAAGAGGTSGTLSWTPTYADSGSYTARFIASAHGLADTSVTLIHVTNVDRPPDVTSPASALGSEATPLTVNVTASDLDGDVIASLAAILTDLPAGAGFTAGAGNTTGTLGWTPSYADSGSYPVRFVATAGGLADTSVTLIHVGNADRAPEVTAPASAAGTEAVPLTVNVAATDVDGDAISSLDVIAADLPAGAGFTAGAGNTTGTLNWTPGYADSGNRSVRFVAVAHGLADTSVTVIHVTNVDRRPDVVSAASVAWSEGTPLTVNATASDLDGDAIALTADLTGLPVGAGFAAGAGGTSGTLSWTPTYADSGTYGVRFIASANGLADTSVTSIHVANGDRPPDVVSPASAPGSETTPLTVDVTASDLDGDAISSLAAILTDLPAGAGFTAGAGNTAGTLSWTPSYADSGSHPVRFVATAGGLADTAVTVIHVGNVDRGPEVTSLGEAAGSENALLSIVATASDADLDAIVLSAELVSPPAGYAGVFTPGGGGTSGTLAWTPGYADSGAYTVRFIASAHGLADTSYTSLHVANVDRAPDVGIPATVSGPEAAQLTVNVSVADPDGDAIASLTADLSAIPPGNASFTESGSHTTGTFTWTPTFSDSGSYPIRFIATAHGLADTAMTVLVVGNVDHAPEVTAPASASTSETGVLVVNATASDVDNDAITLTADLTAVPNASFTSNPEGSSGTLTWTTTHADSGHHPVRFIATANGQADTAVTTLIVTNVDRGPDVVSAASVAGSEGTPLTVNVTASDLDGDAIALTADLTGLPVGAGFAAGAGGTSGTLSWTPTYADSGTYGVRFIASANGLADTSVTSIHIANGDRPPDVSSPLSAAATETSPVQVNVTASDLDGDAISSLNAILTDLPAGAGFTAGAGNTTGTLSWTPSYADSGSHPVRFVATSGGLADTAVTVIHVGNVDRGPEVTSLGEAAGSENALLTIVATASDADLDAIVLSAELVSPPAGYAGVFTPGGGGTSGTLAWTPGYADSGAYTVRFIAAAHGLADTSFTSLHVANLDRAPDVASPANVSVPETVLLNVNVTAVDLDGDALTDLSADLSALPSGAASFTAAPGFATGTLTWTPTVNDSGLYQVRFFTAAHGLGDTAVTMIHVGNADRAPEVTAPASAAGTEAVPLTVNVSATDIDGDAISSLDVIAADVPGATFTPGAGNTTGTLAWTPSYADSGSRTVRFVAVAHGLADTATTVFHVTNVDRGPDVVSAASVAGSEATPLTVNVTASDLDGDAIALTADLTGLPVGAGFTAGAGGTGGTLSWTPTYADSGSYTVRFFASAHGLADTSVTSIHIANVDRKPVVTAPASPSGTEGQPLTVVVTAADPDGDEIGSLTAITTGLPAGHTASFTAGAGNTSGTLSWTPASGMAGNHPVKFIATNALADTATRTIAVGGGTGPNLVTNPSFETNTNGWSSNGGSSIARVSGGHDGSFALRVTGPNSTATNGVNDSPNWVTNAGAIGTRYRFIAWVRSDAAHGAVQFKVREYVGSNSQGGTRYSPPVTLSSTWQKMTFDVLNVAANSFFDMQILNTPAVNGEVFLIDEVSIAVAGGAVDQKPVVGAPATASGIPGVPITVNVTASDPDGQAITSLTANLSALPAGHTASFTANAAKTSGTFTWTPTGAMLGNFTIKFIAANALTDSAATAITVTADRKPVVTAPASAPATEGSPVSVTVTASDPDGQAITSLTANLSALPPNTASFSTNAAKTSGTLSWTPAAGTAGSYLVRFIAANALIDSAATTLTVTAPSGGGTNLCGNPSFETNTNGWAGYSGGTLARVAGGQLGSWTARVTGPSSTAQFGLNDSPNWITNGGALGSRYRFRAWVRSVSHVGLVKLRIREYLGSTAVGVNTYSPSIALSSTWQELTVDYVTTRAGSALDFNVLDSPVANAEVFLVDNVSITLVTPEPGLMASQAPQLESAEPIRFSARVFPNPVHVSGTLRFSTSREGAVRIQIFDTSGRLARTLLDEPSLPAGYHDVSLGNRSDPGARLPAGLYFYRLQATEGTRSGRFVLVD